MTFTAETVNRLCEAASLDFHFEEVVLEGNLRSSPKISDLTMKYQSISTANTANIPVQTTLQFSSLAPKIEIVESDDRVTFGVRVLSHVEEALSESKDTQIHVLCLCHHLLARSIKGSLRPDESERVTLSAPEDILGCQFASVVVAIDMASIAPSFQHVTDMLTRATTIVKCVVNTSKKPFLIRGRPSFATAGCFPEEVPNFFQQINGNYLRPVYVYDVRELIPQPIKNQLDLDLQTDFNWWRQGQTSAEMLEKSIFAGVVVSTSGPTGMSSQCQRVLAPVIELIVLRRDMEDCDRNYDEVYRKPINTFFKKYAQSAQK